MGRVFSIILLCMATIVSQVSAFQNSGHLFSDHDLRGPEQNGSSISRPTSSMQSEILDLQSEVRHAKDSRAVTSFEERLQSYPPEIVAMLGQALEEVRIRRELFNRRFEEYWADREGKIAELIFGLREIRAEAFDRCAGKAYERRQLQKIDIDIFQEWLNHHLEKALASYYTASLYTKFGGNEFCWPVYGLYAPGDRRRLDYIVYQDQRDFELNPLDRSETMEGYQLWFVERGAVRELALSIPPPVNAIQNIGGRMFGLTTGCFQRTFYAERNRRLNRFFSNLDQLQRAWSGGVALAQLSAAAKTNGLMERVGRFQAELEEFQSQVKAYLEQEEVKAAREKSARTWKWFGFLGQKSSELTQQMSADAEELKKSLPREITIPDLRQQLSDLDALVIRDYLDIEEPKLKEDIYAWLKSASSCNVYIDYAEILKENFLDWVEEKTDRPFYEQCGKSCHQCLQVARVAINMPRKELKPIIDVIYKNYTTGVWHGEEAFYRQQDYAKQVSQEQKDAWREQAVAWFTDKMGRSLVPLEENIASIDRVLDEEFPDYYAYLDRYLIWSEAAEQIFKSTIQEYVNLQYELLELKIKEWEPGKLWTQVFGLAASY